MSDSRTTKSAATLSIARKLYTFGFSLAAFYLFVAVLAPSSAAQRIIETRLPDAAQTILAPLAGDFTNRQAAASVLGQSSFTSGNPAFTASRFFTPDGVVVDPVSRKAFVVDQDNRRVLRFSSTAALQSGSAAEAVLGQTDFVSQGSGASASKFNAPTDVSIDAGGRLWVCDFFNNRVLRFDNAATKANGANADGVLGQTDFTTVTADAGANKMSFPFGIFADALGRLWVADRRNNRVLRFDNAAAKANGANADAVLGQPDFTTTTAGAGANQMDSPQGVNLDTGGRLYVADFNNSRVLRFDAAATKAFGANADAVFGQPDFATVSAGTTAGKMSSPVGVGTDANNRLYVADFNNNRVIIFNNAGIAASGASANVVLGQPDFTTNTANNGGVSAVSLANPYHLSFDETSISLFVADRGNNRVLRFAAPAAPTAALVTVSGRVWTGRKTTARARVKLTDGAGQIRFANANAFGYFKFFDVAAGETYIFNASLKGFEFAPQVVYVTEDVNGLNFTGQ